MATQIQQIDFTIKRPTHIGIVFNNNHGSFDINIPEELLTVLGLDQQWSGNESNITFRTLPIIIETIELFKQSADTKDFLHRFNFKYNSNIVHNNNFDRMKDIEIWYVPHEWKQYIDKIASLNKNSLKQAQ